MRHQPQRTRLCRASGSRDCADAFLPLFCLPDWNKNGAAVWGDGICASRAQGLDSGISPQPAQNRPVDPTRRRHLARRRRPRHPHPDDPRAARQICRCRPRWWRHKGNGRGGYNRREPSVEIRLCVRTHDEVRDGAAHRVFERHILRHEIHTGKAGGV
jgi:hypothetical protein